MPALLAHLRSMIWLAAFVAVAALGLFLISGTVLAQNSTGAAEAMAAANQQYESGEFQAAAEAYEAIIRAGTRDSSVYYNLGNAYFKQGDLGRAILSYRRAHALNPRDPDIVANLRIARAQTVDQIEATAAGSVANFIQVAEDWLTLHEAGILALALWLLMGFFALLAVFKPSWRRWTGFVIAVLALFLAIGLLSMASRFYRAERYPPAVVVAEQVNVTSGPGSADQYLLEFTLHSGTEVLVLESRSGWRRVSLPGDLQGWVNAEAIEPVLTDS
jgi:tetratricopeptide (TPR) repeat protein